MFWYLCCFSSKKQVIDPYQDSDSLDSDLSSQASTVNAVIVNLLSDEH